MLKQQLNLNITGDDYNVNDYLHCWKEFCLRPNKLSIVGQYEPDDFLKFIGENKIWDSGTFTDMVPQSEISLVNEKCLVRIHNSVFISYVHLDKLNPEGFITEVSFYYDDGGLSRVQSFIQAIDKFIIEEDSMGFETNSSNLTTIFLSQNGIELEPISLMKADYENIEYYFNDETIKKKEKFLKSLKKEEKGLTVIYGERGCGKTTLVNHIVSKTDKNVIFIPSVAIDTIFNSIDFLTFVKRYKNSIIVIDDCELFFNETYTKSNIFTNNLLQFVDGFQSDSLGLHIIAVLNTGDVGEIDHLLLECNNLIDVIEVDELTKQKANDLSSFLNKKNKFKSSVKLVDVLKKRVFTSHENEMGF